ncbi:MAG: NAD(P)H-dependent oxidoreductase [Deltaproteobacteria bacterium]|nr:NAD(P)H-dependent oxidoreductase [Candidatus Zymogenaceae bacterium]
MKMLVLNGSPKKKGKVAGLLSAVVEGANATHDIEWIDVYNLSIKPCIGCMKCRPDKPCAQPTDGSYIVAEKIAAADVLVVGTPTYWGNMSAPLKALFDRIVTTLEYIETEKMSLPRPLLKGKRAVIVTASSAPWPLNLLSSSARGAVRSVSVVLKSAGMRIVGTIMLGNTRTMDAIPPRAVRRARSIGRAL